MQIQRMLPMPTTFDPDQRSKLLLQACCLDWSLKLFVTRPIFYEKEKHCKGKTEKQLIGQSSA